jgi:hypothetical protein
MTFRRITVSPGQMGGMPCVRGLRMVQIALGELIQLRKVTVVEDDSLAVGRRLYLHWEESRAAAIMPRSRRNRRIVVAPPLGRIVWDCRLRMGLERGEKPGGR